MNWSICALLLVSCLVMSAEARPVRRMFEPTDLEWEAPGESEVDLQLGLIRGPDSYRLIVPDFEVDVGLTRRVELDLDGALALEGPLTGQDTGALRYDHVAIDNMWLALKVGLLSFEDKTQSRIVATGLQLGPKLPTAAQARGVGVESLLLVGLELHRTFLSLNVGALLDPAIGNSGRPRGVEAGMDLEQALDQAKHWSLLGEIGGVRFSSVDANQLHTTFGAAYSPADAVTFSLVGLAGLLRGCDRYGVLLGVSPKLRLWGG